ncbi:MAG: LysR family transcriptional regulator [Myxococcales bacterium]|nr:LysR family transcriptional regulator [Myxococcales bacterium]
MSLPDPDSLRCFLAAAELLSFRAAAERVHLSAAAFSDRIRRLEEDLDVRLFERSTRRVELTAAGRRLKPQAERALAEAGACKAVVHAEDRPLPFELTLGTRFELGLSWLLPALDPLQAARPDRRLNLSFGVGPDLWSRIARGEVDAVVTSTRLTVGELDYALLHEERYVFCGAPALLAQTPLGHPDDARAHTLLDAFADLPLFRYLLDARPAADAWGFRRTELLGTIAAIRLRALAGKGVAVLPAYFVADDLAAGRLVAVLPDHPLQHDWFRLIWRRGHPLAEELRALAEALRGFPLR